MVKFVSEESVRGILSWDKLIPCMENALKEFSSTSGDSRAVIQPLRTRMQIPENDGLILLMPGYLPSVSAIATKIVSIFPENEKRNIPSHSASIILICPETGRHLAFIEGGSVTELRTAATSTLASRKLCNGVPKIVAILGAGTQGKAHARAHYHLFKPKEILIWSRSHNRSISLEKLLRDEGIPARSVETVKEAVQNADIINTCTLAPHPILFEQDTKKGVHINAVGAARPDHQEIDPRLMLSSVVIADSKEAAEKESGDVIKSGAKIFSELGSVCVDENDLGRKTTIFKSLGMAILDVAAAKLVYDSVLEGD